MNKKPEVFNSLEDLGKVRDKFEDKEESGAPIVADLKDYNLGTLDSEMLQAREAIKSAEAGRNEEEVLKNEARLRQLEKLKSARSDYENDLLANDRQYSEYVNRLATKQAEIDSVEAWDEEKKNELISEKQQLEAVFQAFVKEKLEPAKRGRRLDSAKQTDAVEGENAAVSGQGEPEAEAKNNEDLNIINDEAMLGGEPTPQSEKEEKSETSVEVSTTKPNEGRQDGTDNPETVPVKNIENDSSSEGVKKFAGALVGTTYKTVTSIIGVKLLTDLGLSAVAATGKLAGKLLGSEKIEKNFLFEAAKQNDLYQTLRDKFGKRGAGQAREELKKEFGQEIPAEAEAIAAKLDSIKTKLAEKKNWSEEQKQAYLAKIEAVLTKAAGQSQAQRQETSNHLENLTEAYLKDKVASMTVLKDASNLILSAFGFQAFRSLAYASVSVYQRGEKASQEYDKGLVIGEKPASSRFKHVIKDVCIGSVKDTWRELTFSNKGEEKTGGWQKSINFIKGVGTLSRAIGIGGLGLHEFIDSANLPENSGSHSLFGSEGNIALTRHRVEAEGFSDKLKAFSSSAWDNIHSNFNHATFNIFKEEAHQSAPLDASAGGSSQIIDTHNQAPTAADTSSSKILSTEEMQKINTSGQDSIINNAEGTPPLDHNISGAQQAEAGFKDYIASDKIINSNPDIKLSLEHDQITQVATIEKGQGIAAALGHKYMSGQEPALFVQPDGSVIEARVGDIFVHPGDKVIETGTGAIYVIKDSGIKGVNIEEWNKLHNPESDVQTGSETKLADQSQIKEETNSDLSGQEQSGEYQDQAVETGDNKIASGSEGSDKMVVTEQEDLSGTKQSLESTTANSSLGESSNEPELSELQTREIIGKSALVQLGLKEEDISLKPDGLFDVHPQGADYHFQVECDNSGQPINYFLFDSKEHYMANGKISEEMNKDLAGSMEKLAHKPVVASETKVETSLEDKSTVKTGDNKLAETKELKTEKSKTGFWERLFGSKSSKKTK